MEIGMSVIEVLVDYVTRMHYCAYKDGLLDEYARMLSWINALSSSVNVAISFVSSLSSYFGAMDTLQFNLNFGVFQKFREFKNLISGLDGVADFLSFLNFIADFRLCIPKVYIGSCCIDFGFFDICFPCVRRIHSATILMRICISNSVFLCLSLSCSRSTALALNGSETCCRRLKTLFAAFHLLVTYGTSFWGKQRA